MEAPLTPTSTGSSSLSMSTGSSSLMPLVHSAHSSISSIAIEAISNSTSMTISTGSSSKSDVFPQTAENKSNHPFLRDIFSERLPKSSKDSPSTPRSRSSSMDGSPSIISDILSRPTDPTGSNSETTRSASNSLNRTAASPKAKDHKWKSKIDKIQDEISRVYTEYFGYEEDKEQEDKESNGIRFDFTIPHKVTVTYDKIHFKFECDSNADFPSKEVEETLAYILAHRIVKKLKASSIKSERERYQKMTDPVQISQAETIGTTGLSKAHANLLLSISSRCSAAIKPEDETLAIHHSFVDIMTFIYLHRTKLFATTAITWNKQDDFIIGKKHLDMQINGKSTEPRDISKAPKINMKKLRTFKEEEHRLEHSIDPVGLEETIEELNGRKFLFQKCINELTACLAALKAVPSSESSEVSRKKLQIHHPLLQSAIDALRIQETCHKSEILEENIKQLNESASTLKKILDDLEQPDAQQKLNLDKNVLLAQDKILSHHKQVLSTIQEQLDAKNKIKLDHHKKLEKHKKDGEVEFSVEKISQILLYVFFETLKIITTDKNYKKGGYKMLTNAWLTAVRTMDIKTSLDAFARSMLGLILQKNPNTLLFLKMLDPWDDVGILNKV